MAGSNHPFPRHQVSTRFLRVPVIDWPSVRSGVKTEFRTRPREGSRLLTCNLPTPVVAYSRHDGGPFDAVVSELMVLEHRKYEPLFNISDDPEALARENCETYDAFRSYWKGRNGGRYVPMQKVWVWRVRHFQPTDIERLGAALIGDLYQEHLIEWAH